MVNLDLGRWELYDVAADPTETRDLAGARPEVVTSLSKKYADWARRVGLPAVPGTSEK